ncbi:hypothetical protein KJ973_02765 [Patescibacteria group bacterium]|nr:hypothetical protein [Patescibacteria group bacterium]MBU1519586.1 hypothetical protein [Patescibacteria group bacterium]MBU2416636.1 hypothetical protein [Patescibacteria group bacterium]MBU2460912.1 hypothetical protein [Patescibacteria group bacterium]
MQNKYFFYLAIFFVWFLIPHVTNASNIGTGPSCVGSTADYCFDETNVNEFLAGGDIYDAVTGLVINSEHNFGSQTVEFYFENITITTSGKIIAHAPANNSGRLRGGTIIIQSNTDLNILGSITTEGSYCRYCGGPINGNTGGDIILRAQGLIVIFGQIVSKGGTSGRHGWQSVSGGGTIDINGGSLIVADSGEIVVEGEGSIWVRYWNGRNGPIGLTSQSSIAILGSVVSRYQSAGESINITAQGPISIVGSVGFNRMPHPSPINITAQGSVDISGSVAVQSFGAGTSVSITSQSSINVSGIVDQSINAMNNIVGLSAKGNIVISGSLVNLTNWGSYYCGRPTGWCSANQGIALASDGVIQLQQGGQIKSSYIRFLTNDFVANLNSTLDGGNCVEVVYANSCQGLNRKACSAQGAAVSPGSIVLQGYSQVPVRYPVYIPGIPITTGQYTSNQRDNRQGPSACDPYPRASFTVTPASGDINTNFDFDAFGSSDIDDLLADLQVRWDWENDGVWDTAWTTTKIATHKYITEGMYTIKLEVKNTKELTANVTRQVNVCSSHASWSCYSNDVYWYDSCGTREDKKQECGDNSTGAWGANYCKADDSLYHSRVVHQRGCAGSSCYDNTSTEEELVETCDDGDSGTTDTCNAGSCVYTPISPPTLTISVNPMAILSGEQTTVSWSSTNTTDCVGRLGGAYPTSGSFDDSPASLPRTYTLTCTGPGGSIKDSATVTEKSSSTLSLSVVDLNNVVVDDYNPIYPGESVTVEWIPVNMSSCSGIPTNLGFSSTHGSVVHTPIFSNTPPPPYEYTYTINCTGLDSSLHSESVTIKSTRDNGICDPGETYPTAPKDCPFTYELF